MLNKVQMAAYDLIQSDARFLYTIVHIYNNAENIESNYIMMCTPYIGIFTDGVEQWCKKIGAHAPVFNKAEKEFYTALRQSHKLFEKAYEEYTLLLLGKLRESDKYFYDIRSLYEKFFGYYNVGVDYCNGEFCGNTILCAMYMPFKLLGNENAGIQLKELMAFTGEISAYILGMDIYPYSYDDKKVIARYQDYHFYQNCPIKLKNDLGFVLFCILCSINYVIEFIDKYFVEEIPQKFKYAYLQYYYLCDFLEELNAANKTNYYINKSLQSRSLRNCLAHYGLGQFLKEQEIVDEDIMKGLTNKAFDMDYYICKNQLYKYLRDLGQQIKNDIF